MRLEPGRVAVVTGGASGIGLALARGLASAGMRVVLADVRTDPVAAAVESIAASGGRAQAVTADVTEPADVDRLADLAWSLGDVQVVCSNAGIAGGGPAWEIPAAQWRRIVEVNLMASVHVMRAFVPRLIDGGSPAHLLITGSMASVTVRAGNAPYSTAKHGLLALAETLRDDLAAGGHPIGVSLLMPGLVATPMIGDYALGHAEAITAEDAAEAGLRAIAEDRLFAFARPDRLVDVRERFAAITGDR